MSCNTWATAGALSFLAAKAKKAQSLPQLLVLVALNTNQTRTKGPKKHSFS